MSIVIKKRGRPTKEMVAAREAANVPKPKRSDSEILADLTERFDILTTLTEGAVHKNVRAVTVSGAPGVGKTYTVEQVLERAKEEHGINYEIVRGAISAVHLYKLGYQMRFSNCVLVLDDADSIFQDEEALNVLKALCDTGITRRVSWMKESGVLKEDDVPTSYDFNGAMIFISNLDFQRYIETGGNKYVQHFEAVMSRSLYLDLRLHDRDEIGVWVNHVATTGNIFAREGLTQEQGLAIMQFIKNYRNDLRELSIRTVLKLAQIVKTNAESWERVARVLLVKY